MFVSTLVQFIAYPKVYSNCPGTEMMRLPPGRQTRMSTNVGYPGPQQRVSTTMSSNLISRSG